MKTVKDINNEKIKVNIEKKSPLVVKKQISEMGRKKSKDVDIKIIEESVKKVKVENNMRDIVKSEEDGSTQLKRSVSDPIINMNIA